MTALSPPRAVLYDWDNTLVDNWGAIIASINHTLVEFGQQPWSATESRAQVKQSLRDSFPRLFQERWLEARDVFYAHFAEHHLEHLRPLEGALALLAHFAELGVYQAVVSNKTGRFLRLEAEHLGWTGHFGRLVGAQDAPRDKPDPAPVLLALEPAGLAPGPLVWFVGDADIDMECAHAAGCVPVLVGQGVGDGFDRFPPTLRVDTCHALRALAGRVGEPISFGNPVETGVGG